MDVAQHTGAPLVYQLFNSLIDCTKRAAQTMICDKKLIKSLSIQLEAYRKRETEKAKPAKKRWGWNAFLGFVVTMVGTGVGASEVCEPLAIVIVCVGIFWICVGFYIWGKAESRVEALCRAAGEKAGTEIVQRGKFYTFPSCNRSSLRDPACRENLIILMRIVEAAIKLAWCVAGWTYVFTARTTEENGDRVFSSPEDKALFKSQAGSTVPNLNHTESSHLMKLLKQSKELVSGERVKLEETREDLWNRTHFSISSR